MLCICIFYLGKNVNGLFSHTYMCMYLLQSEKKWVFYFFVSIYVVYFIDGKKWTVYFLIRYVYVYFTGKKCTVYFLIRICVRIFLRGKKVNALFSHTYVCTYIFRVKKSETVYFLICICVHIFYRAKKSKRIIFSNA